MVKFRGLSLHVARMEEARSDLKTVTAKPRGKRFLGIMRDLQ